jgi:hypothetical protein
LNPRIISTHSPGGFIHLLLVLAVIVVLIRNHPGTQAGAVTLRPMAEITRR